MVIVLGRIVTCTLKIWNIFTSQKNMIVEGGTIMSNNTNLLNGFIKYSENIAISGGDKIGAPVGNGTEHAMYGFPNCCLPPLEK